RCYQHRAGLITMHLQRRRIMTAPESTVRSLPAQPPEPNPPTATRIYRGDAIISLMEMVEHCIPTAQPLMSWADLRIQERVLLSIDEVLDRIGQRSRE